MAEAVFQLDRVHALAQRPGRERVAEQVGGNALLDAGHLSQGAGEWQASAETPVRHQPKLHRAAAEHGLSCLSRSRTKGESRLGDSNPGPMVYKTIALPLS